MKYTTAVVGALMVFCATPMFVHAITITEIQYDPPGTDAGHEWIEIYNNQDEAIDLTGWKLFENNVNHGIAAYTESLVLPAGAYAVIADQPAQVIAAYPTIEYVFDSAFSLNNTGETLVLKNKELVMVDTVTYNATSGGSGNGATLNKVGNAWVPRMPSPGNPPSTTTPSEPNTNSEEGNGSSDSAYEHDDPDGTPTQSASDAAQKKEAPKEPLYTLTLEIDAIAVANDPVIFKGVFTKDTLTLQSGRFEWNLGDGTYFTANKLTQFLHTYQSPGTYVVVLEYYRTVFDEVPFLRVVKPLEVITGSVMITEISPGGSIVLNNEDQKDVSLADWKIIAGAATFTFPKNTILQSEGTLAIPFTVHGLGVGPRSSVSLFKPDGTRIAVFPRERLRTSADPAIQSFDDEAAAETGISEERARIKEVAPAESGAPRKAIRSTFIILCALGGMMALGCVLVFMVMRKNTILLAEEEGGTKKPQSFDDIHLLR